ncbi:uncharacterized protein LOC143703212 [Siphateles boraxobius]|uniref:uncharacterized protein LOC143703212 n=1 Tax=Siphateles boraxobius TaxID=180520 RepID=UPI00406479A7
MFYWDILRTAPNGELESEVINAYIAQAVKKNNQIRDEKALQIDSFEMTRIWEKKNSRLKCDPIKYKVILGAVHEPGHWMLAAIFPAEKRSLVLDPLGNDARKIKQCLESTRAFVRKRGCNVSKWTASTAPHSSQLDGTSCGVFVLKMTLLICAAIVGRIMWRRRARQHLGSSVMSVPVGST